ncbi:hypothetical protein CH249_14385 [Rhodococcus sp. 05-2255-3B1]|jgi:hypothetical protein|uniref:DUF2637 domain-containing protein n=1 Tax=unclassified Rhodococcus (in: high G+C Gram-positive bacteria) TaxID=192944 RepID=UPI000B9A66C3|nr:MULTISPECIES: DUF2637 domain-containing protein [unclassified Rhodococcus (in: high G+C Gram-positive bacteria)]OZE10087.1 hypothetical protein CH249_14385 [Rhodococcus sp. 05-2255-3B1]OZE10264.1 hypothetical protein CH250_13305 [Rhodococcus sp. 05-2255-3C]OZE24391.1 hypothetical protein CH255_01960 [Rhodococcus sp. 05-2255-2A2]
MPHFRPADATAKVGTTLIALGAFWLSFTALRDLAVRSGVPAGQAWVWPLIVDGLVLVATVAVVALDHHRWYAWTLLGIGASLSLAGNSLHATYTGELPVAVRILVAAVPPLSLLAVTHLTYLLAHRPPGHVTDIHPSVSVKSTTASAPAPLLTTVRATEQEMPDLAASFRMARQTG